MVRPVREQLTPTRPSSIETIYVDVPARDPARGRFRRFGDLVADTSAPEFLVYPILERDAVGILFGDSQSFKSFLAVELGTAIASGSDRHGWLVKPGAVFFIVGEGQGGFRRRLRAQQIHHGLPDELPLFVRTLPMELIEAGDTLAVATLIREAAKAAGVEPALIVIDTLSQNAGAVDENSNSDVARLLSNVSAYLREAFQACVLLVHHVGHGSKDRTRGAHALMANVDFALRLERRENSDTTVLFSAKVKDGPEWEPVAFEAHAVELPGMDNPDGTPVTSLVLNRLEKLPEPGHLSAMQAAALEVLRGLYESRRITLERSGYPPEQARVQAAEWREALEEKKVIERRQRFYELQKELGRKRLIRAESGFVHMVE